MQTVKERAAIGTEVAREEGKSAGGRAIEAVENVVTGRDGPNRRQPFHSGAPGSGVGNVNGLQRTEADLKNLENRSVVTGHGEAFCPNPNDKHLPKEFETRVQVIQKYPEMKAVQETFFVKEVRHEDRIVAVPRTRVLMEEHERIDMVSVVKKVPRIRIETVHRVVTEEREVTDMVAVVEMVEVPRMEVIPRVITENVEETVSVPVVIEVPQVRTIQVPTGNFCEAPAGEYVNPGHFNLVGGGHGIQNLTINRSTSSSSSSSDDETKGRLGHETKGPPLKSMGVVGPQESVASSLASSSPDNRFSHPIRFDNPSTTGRKSKKKPSLLQKIEAKLTS